MIKSLGLGGRQPSQAQKTDTNNPAAMEVVPTSDAYSLAKSWLSKMSGADESEEEEELPHEPESRPPRLGLGAKFLPHSQVAATMSTVEKRLRAKLGPTAKGGEAAGLANAPGPSGRKRRREEDEARDEEDEDEEEESRARMFSKRGVGNDGPQKDTTFEENVEMESKSTSKKKKRKKKKKQEET